MSWFISKSNIDGSGKGICSRDFDGPKGCNFKFRMLDADGEIYYEGFSSVESFAPLDDFGEPESGCIEIQYWHESGFWWML